LLPHDLYQILKQEWPHNWPTFIPEIVASSKTSLPLCENNMVILKLLSEEVFDFSAEQMTQEKAKNLKNSLNGEFSDIFQLCLEVLEKAQKPSLIKATLETLLRFLNWIPLGYIFETSIIDQLLNRVSPPVLIKEPAESSPLSQFLEPPEYRNVTLKCLSEIAGLNVGAEYDVQFVVLFTMVMTAVNKMVRPSRIGLYDLDSFPHLQDPPLNWYAIMWTEMTREAHPCCLQISRKHMQLQVTRIKN
jgi:exportin-1